MYIALACFALEYLTLLSGVSIFFRTLNCSHILLHFTGAVLVALFYTQVRSSSQATISCSCTRAATAGAAACKPACAMQHLGSMLRIFHSTCCSAAGQ